MTRRPIAAGSFYEAKTDKLEDQIKSCFLSAKGPGALPINKRKGPVLGAICPHAGYMYSGQCAAWAYKVIAESEFADVYVVIGPNHTGIGKSSTTLENYETPFGVVRIDQEFAQMLVKNSDLVEDNEAHAGEHSVEAQLPFLQFATRDFSNELKIVPIVASHDFNFKRLGLDLKETIVDSGKKVCVIASSDFTHYGRNYHYVPFSSDVQKRMYDLDGEAIGLIKKFDSEGLFNYIYETGATICGCVPIGVLLNAIKAKKAELLQYYTSGDIVNDYKNSVGYASMTFS